jgi:flagellar biosynthesis/type III secretory pathway M-ring protein FliF/YscJ
MQNVRRLILYLASVIGVWLLVSFGGAMVDSANAAFWSSSLMWALLSFLVIMPALVMVNHASNQSTRRATPSKPQSTPAQSEQKPFVEDESDQVRTLWPEPNQPDDEWPPQDLIEEEKQQRVRA